MPKTLAFSALAVLTACGGGGGGGPVYVAPSGGQALVLYQEAQTIQGFFNSPDSSLSLLEISPVGYDEAQPISGGSATFEGVMIMEKTAPGKTYIGDVSFLATFSAPGDINGAATDFYVYDSSTGDVSGPLGAEFITLWAEDLTPDANKYFDLNISGTLEGNSVSGPLDAQFGAVGFRGTDVAGHDIVAFSASGPIDFGSETVGRQISEPLAQV